MAIGPNEFRLVMRHWTSGVTVISTRRPGGIHGMTASSFSSLSLDPPLVLVCVDRRARTHQQLQEQDSFVVHILAEGQAELSRCCAGAYGEIGNELHDVPYRAGVTGAPVLEECLAFMECRAVAAYDGGDHTIFVGEIVHCGANDGLHPLVYFSGAYRRLADA